MKIVEIRRLDGEDRIFIENELFDWGIDEEAINKINEIDNKEELDKVHENIRLYFLNSFENFVGKSASIKQIYEGIQLGRIDL